jgi:sugar lactone lactonase YvrE
MVHAALAWGSEEEAPDIYLRAEPNGLAWDADRGALLVVDAHGGSIVRVADHRRGCHAAIDVRRGDRLAAIVLAPDGTAYVSRVGNDDGGAVFEIASEGQVTALAVPATPWRLGLAYDATSHALYATQFVKLPGRPFEGSIVRIDLVDGTTTTILAGLVKPIGLAKLGPQLLVADAHQRAIYLIGIADREASACVRRPLRHRPDSLCAYDDDSALLTTFDPSTGRGALCRMWLDGRTRTITSGMWEPRGVASDGHRAFVSIRRGGRVLVQAIE